MVNDVPVDYSSGWNPSHSIVLEEFQNSANTLVSNFLNSSNPTLKEGEKFIEELKNENYENDRA